MQHYQQQEFHHLVDLLAKETELYTKALSSGKQGDITRYKENIDTLVAEITRRKKSQSMPPAEGRASRRSDFLGMSS
jgi:hypothetical protein